jgi:excisionase family DNA binding protein
MSQATLDDVLREVRSLREDLAKSKRLPALMTAYEAAEYLGVSVVTVRRWDKEGKIKGRGIGKDKRYALEDLEAGTNG